MMDHSLEDARDLARERKWQSYFQADVEHPSTKKLIGKLNERQRATIEDFTAANFESRMDFLTKQIEDGTIAPAQQVLVIVDTHGAHRDSSGENEIAVSGGSGANLTVPVKKLVAAALAKGVKLGLVLANCYSGDLRRDIGPQPGICVVSASAPARLGTNDFSGIISQMSESPNLEDAYLKTREGMWRSSTQPGINTTAGQKAEDDLAVFRNYHFYPSGAHEAQSDRLCANTPMLTERLLTTAKKVQDRTQIQWYQFWRSTNSEGGRKLVEGLREKEAQLNSVLVPPDTGPWGVSFYDCLDKQPQENSESCEKIHLYDARVLSNVKDRIAMLQANPTLFDETYRLNVFRKNRKKNNPITVEERLAKLRQQQKEVETILQDPKLISIRREVARFKFKSAHAESEKDSLYESSSRAGLSGHERQLYDAFYDHYSKKDAAPNACREFKLK